MMPGYKSGNPMNTKNKRQPNMQITQTPKPNGGARSTINDMQRKANARKTSMAAAAIQKKKKIGGVLDNMRNK